MDMKKHNLDEAFKRSSVEAGWPQAAGLRGRAATLQHFNARPFQP
jgi:hypothetical protein